MDTDQKRHDDECAQHTIADILRRVDSLPILDARTPEEIVGYDENGVPE